MISEIAREIAEHLHDQFPDAVEAIQPYDSCDHWHTNMQVLDADIEGAKDPSEWLSQCFTKPAAISMERSLRKVGYQRLKFVPLPPPRPGVEFFIAGSGPVTVRVIMEKHEDHNRYTVETMVEKNPHEMAG